MVEKTICEQEFEKWWEKVKTNPEVPGGKAASLLIWTSAWLVCGRKVVEAVKETKFGLGIER